MDDCLLLSSPAKECEYDISDDEMIQELTEEDSCLDMDNGDDKGSIFSFLEENFSVVKDNNSYTHRISGYGNILVTVDTIDPFIDWMQKNSTVKVKENLAEQSRPFIMFSTAYDLSTRKETVTRLAESVLKITHESSAGGGGFGTISNLTLLCKDASMGKLSSLLTSSDKMYTNTLIIDGFMLDGRQREMFQSCFDSKAISGLSRILGINEYSIYTDVCNNQISPPPEMVAHVSIRVSGYKVEVSDIIVHTHDNPPPVEILFHLPIHSSELFTPVMYRSEGRIPRNLPLIDSKDLEFLMSLRAAGIFDMIDIGKRIQDDFDTIFEIFYGISGGAKQGLLLLYDRIQNARLDNEEEILEIIYQKWRAGSTTPLGWRSAYYLASLDSPNGWKRRESAIYERMMHSLVAAGSAVTHAVCGSFLYDMYGHMYVFQPNPGARYAGIWLKFEPDGWKLGNSTMITSLLVYELPKKLRSQSRMLDPNDPQYEKSISNLYASIRKIENTGYAESCVKAFSMRVAEREFSYDLNENPNLLNFSNGVWDVTTGDLKTLLPDHKVSFSTGYPFRRFGIQDPAFLFVRKYFVSVYPDEDVRRAAEYAYSSCIYGGNKDKRCYINTGAHDNSKTLMGETLKKVFGEYYIKGDNEELIAHRAGSGNAGGPQPHLIRKRGKRIVMYDELGQSQILDAAKIRHLVGCDSFYARDLHEKGATAREITPQNKIFISCNRPPKIPNIGVETSQKLRVIPHKTTFIKRGDPQYKGVTHREMKIRRLRWIDPKVGEALHKPTCIQAFMYYLILKYKYFLRNGEPVSNEVDIFTKRYVSENDIYENFKNSVIVEAEGVVLDANSAFTKFKTWFEQYFAYESRSVINIISFRTRMSEKLGPLDVAEGGWVGWDIPRTYSNEE